MEARFLNLSQLLIMHPFTLPFNSVQKMKISRLIFILWIQQENPCEILACYI